MTEAFDEKAAARVGYTHLIGGAKTNAAIARSLENRVAREYPEAYERCCAPLEKIRPMSRMPAN